MPESRSWVRPFVAGVLAGGAALTIARSLTSKRHTVDPRLIRHHQPGGRVPPVVIVPGVMGSMLMRPDGTPAWLHLGNAVGYHSLALPARLPLCDCTDDLVPGSLLGAEAMLPRLFGFTEYADLMTLLESAKFRRTAAGAEPAEREQFIFSYDWRRDIVEAARRLHETLERLAEERGEPDLRFNVIGHSMGGLVARYYLRYGTAEPDDPAGVTWAGARRVENLIIVASPNAGGLPALDAVLNGSRVGFSYTTLASAVVAAMPSVYELLPPAGLPALIDERGEPLQADLHDVTTWDRFGWGPFSPSLGVPPAEQQERIDYLAAVLARAAAFHRAMSRRPEAPCPSRVTLLGGDCLPTLTRAVVPAQRGRAPRFEPRDDAEAAAMFEAGDGRVTRASVLASHLAHPESETGCGIPEVAGVFFGHADHHGIYGEPTFQSIILRILLRPSNRRAVAQAMTAARTRAALTGPEASPTLSPLSASAPAEEGGERRHGPGVVRSIQAAGGER